MKRFWERGFVLVVLALAAVMFAGCGHSFGGGGKGIGVRCAWQPDSLMPEFQLGYYETGFACVRENAAYTYNGSGSGGVNAGTADSLASGETGIEISLTTKQQVNGYVADIAKAAGSTAVSADGSAVNLSTPEGN
ncbi:MAG: hypothetical protein PHI85_09080 [Victivallaceae bacterium]|nr:hypothetical protein [Victivallaceae bacterium]